METAETLGELTCTHCELPIIENTAFCPECGYPEKGDEQDVAKFYAKRVMAKNKNMDAEEKIKSARNTLFVMAGLVMLFGFFSFFVNDDYVTLIINFIICCIYLLLGGWSKEKPLIALLLGLLLYITTIIISAIIEPSSLIKGILWKIIIIGYLGKGIYSASSTKDSN
ncbi:hypothetical protein [uncultured Lacinutrix sp.]|uniref:hypothetical protein n=1 Tax=uncultured Lacinutrix sp. TaxID=574032 RepID=UPI002637521F|nr:hypothetical protein [uncultured Lacinutrix sp.]